MDADEVDEIAMADKSSSPGAGTTRRRYSRGEMEALRSAPAAEEQRRRWEEVYRRLAVDGVAGEYDGLCVAAAEGETQRKNKGKKKAGNGGGGRKKQEELSQNLEEVLTTSGNLVQGNPHKHDHMDAYDATKALESEDHYDKCESLEYEDDSDDDYVSILKPAFLVEGDPDFNSGPPLDGFEYLRRVRWEAAQIPKVKVAKIDLSKTRSEQTPYMPEIPQIPKCPPNLSASKQWEDDFLAYFSELRLAFSQPNSSRDELSTIGGNKDTSKAAGCSEPQNVPTVTMVRGMDALSRAATLRNYIDMVESMAALSRNDCLWLFALCVAVDTPLHAETCASLRSLLRKCLSILATKSEIDDEVAMLNILVTISGKYFGQYENTQD